MAKFIARRLLSMIPLMLGISALVFLLMYLAPGDFLSEARNSKDISPEIVKQEEMRLGLDKPWYVQYGRWLNGVSPVKTNFLLPESERGKHSAIYFGAPDFGFSWSYKIPVMELIGQRIFPTLLLALASTFVIYAVSIPLGVLAAVRRDSAFDKLSTFLAYAALSVPYFFLALLAVLFAAVTGLLPTGGQVSILHDFLSPAAKFGDWIKHLVLPTLVLSLGGIASMMRVMRGTFLDYSRADFVTTARAKGMGENAIMFRHVLRNAINPVVTSFGFAFAGLLSGALLVENVMNYPGLGQLIYAAIIKQDQYVVMAGVVIGCAMLVAGQLIADILLALADPRIRLEREKIPAKGIAVFTACAAAAIAGLTWACETFPAFFAFLKTAFFWAAMAGAAVLALMLALGLCWAVAFFCKNLLPQTLRSKRGAAALAILAAMYAAAIFAPFLAPYSPTEQCLDKSFHPPTKIFFENGSLRAQCYRQSDPSIAQYEPVEGESLPIKFFVRDEKSDCKIFGLIPFKARLFGVDSPEPDARVYLLGADSTGRDVFSRLLYGARVAEHRLCGNRDNHGAGVSRGRARGILRGRFRLRGDEVRRVSHGDSEPVSPARHAFRPRPALRQRADVRHDSHNTLRARLGGDRARRQGNVALPRKRPVRPGGEGYGRVSRKNNNKAFSAQCPELPDSGRNPFHTRLRFGGSRAVVPRPRDTGALRLVGADARAGAERHESFDARLLVDAHPGGGHIRDGAVLQHSRRHPPRRRRPQKGLTGGLPACHAPAPAAGRHPKAA